MRVVKVQLPLNFTGNVALIYGEDRFGSMQQTLTLDQEKLIRRQPGAKAFFEAEFVGQGQGWELGKQVGDPGW